MPESSDSGEHSDEWASDVAVVQPARRASLLRSSRNQNVQYADRGSSASDDVEETETDDDEDISDDEESLTDLGRGYSKNTGAASGYNEKDFEDDDESLAKQAKLITLMNAHRSSNFSDDDDADHDTDDDAMDAAKHERMNASHDGSSDDDGDGSDMGVLAWRQEVFATPPPAQSRSAAHTAEKVVVKAKMKKKQKQRQRGGPGSSKREAIVLSSDSD